MSELQCVKFGDIAQQITTKVNPKNTSLNTYVGLEHLDSGSLQIKRRGTPQDVIGEKLRVCKGDIIFGKRRVYQRKLAIADFDGICSAHAMVLRPKEDVVDKDFFPFFMQSDLFMERALQISVGSLSPTINWKTLAVQVFTIPLLSDQHRIAITLWAAEDCIVKGERLLAAAERAKQVLMRELFSKGIGHTKFKDVKGFGKVPIEWDLLILQDLIEIFDCKHLTPQFIEKGFPILRPQNITSGKIDFSEVNFVSEFDCNIMNEKHQPKNGDILFSRNASYGIAVYVDTNKMFCIGQDMVIMTQKTADTNFVFHFLCSELLIKQISKFSMGSTFLRINLADIRRLLIPSPPIHEQRQIAGILTRCNETIAAARANVTAAKALKMKMINELLSPENN
jgi:restriction endonuclease S subunit